MIALERIKEIESVKDMRDWNHQASVQFLLKAFQVMREIAIKECSYDQVRFDVKTPPDQWVDRVFESQMQKDLTKNKFSV